MNLFARLSNGWNICLNSFTILRENKRLVLFPILSGISLILVMGSFITATLAAAGWDPGNITYNSRFANYALLFGYYLVNYFIVVFFNTALMYCTRAYFNGGQVSVREGLRFSISRIGAIFSWAVFAATVGAVLRIIQENAGTLGKFITGFIGIVWSVATFFVVPVIAYEHAGPLKAFKRSSQLMKEKWGESLAATFSLGIVQFIAILLVSVPFLIIGFFINFYIGLILGAICAFLVMAVMSAAQHIFISAVYQDIQGDPVKHYNRQLADKLFLNKP